MLLKTLYSVCITIILISLINYVLEVEEKHFLIVIFQMNAFFLTSGNFYKLFYTIKI